MHAFGHLKEAVGPLDRMHRLLPTLERNATFSCRSKTLEWKADCCLQRTSICRSHFGSSFFFFFKRLCNCSGFGRDSRTSMSIRVRSTQKGIHVAIASQPSQEFEGRIFSVGRNYYAEFRRAAVAAKVKNICYIHLH